MRQMITVVGFLFLALVANAKTWDLNSVIRSADSSETKDLAKVLGDIDLGPAEGSASSRSLMVVKRVAAGSIYERAGIKAGDLVSTGTASNSRSLELKSSLEASAPDSGAVPD